MTIDLTKWVVHKDNDCDCVPRRDFLKAACEDTLFVVLEWFAYDFQREVVSIRCSMKGVEGERDRSFGMGIDFARGISLFRFA